tara:strand:- start:270 stop:458 length:189 start_codon:yes stop_codon:yes gene_type:complete
MKIGNLVRIKRSGIGLPTGTIGMIVESWQMPYTILHAVKLLTGQLSGKERRFVPGDLEVISS